MSSCPPSAAAACVNRFGAVANCSESNCACVNPARIAERSRGPPRSSASRESARSMSGTRRKLSRSFARKRLWSSIYRTDSNRERISGRSQDGLESRRSKSLAPPAVAVRSIVASSDPSRPPERAEVNSRLRRVAASICMLPPVSSRSGASNIGNLPRWVRSR